MTALVPNQANAFWFFSLNANAASGAGSPGTSTLPLEAATNIDPNPTKGVASGIQISDNAMLAYSGPSGTIADVANVPPPDHISVYVVRTGDSLSEIAAMFNVSVNTIVWANNLSSTKDVHPGDTLIILPVSGVTHIAVKGDTLKSLATKYSGNATEIAQYNGLDSSAPLAVGSSVIIPGGEFTVARATVTTTRTTAARSTPSKHVSAEPYLGGSGTAQNGYYGDPVPGGIITQGIHGWNAVDIGAARGTPVHAAAGGTVIVSKNNGAWNGGYGNYVVITHSNGTQTLYAHMSASTVRMGQAVTEGQVIGHVGMTGMTTGPHVHFEVRGAANPFRNCREGTRCSPR